MAPPDWMQLAAHGARHPRRSSARIACWVFALLSLAFVGLGLLTLWASTLPEEELGAPPATFGYIGAGVLVVGLLMVPLALLFRGKLRSLKRCRELLRAAVERAGGESLVDGRHVAHWLAMHWRGDDYPYRSLSTAEDILCAALWIEGFPVLVDVTPIGFHVSRGEGGGSSTFWARVVVATDLPGNDPDFPAAHPELGTSIGAHGFELKRDNGALVARGTRSVERALSKDPERIADLLEVAAALARVAKACGGRPVIRR